MQFEAFHSVLQRYSAVIGSKTPASLDSFLQTDPQHDQRLGPGSLPENNHIYKSLSKSRMQAVQACKGPHWQLRVLQGLDDMPHQQLEGAPLPGTSLKLNVCICACHPAGLGSQMPMWATEGRLHILHQHALQLVLVWLLQARKTVASL